MKDYSKEQFEIVMHRHGFKKELMGYWQIGGGVSVCVRNGGDTYLEQLVYAIEQAQLVKERNG